MKKGILLTCLTLISAITLTTTGCAKKDGVYSFSYIEFAEDGQTKQSKCKNPTGTHEALFCQEVEENEYYSNKIKLKDNKLIINSGDDTRVEYFYKISKNSIMVSETEDGEYEPVENLYYKDKKIQYITDFYTIVLEK